MGTNVVCQSERCQLTDDKAVKICGFKGGDCEESCLLGSDGVLFGTLLPTFRGNLRHLFFNLRLKVSAKRQLATDHSTSHPRRQTTDVF
jgi:hypothetical protein